MDKRTPLTGEALIRALALAAHNQNDEASDDAWAIRDAISALTGGKVLADADLAYDASTRAFELREMLHNWNAMSGDVMRATIADALAFCERVAAPPSPAVPDQLEGVGDHG